MNVITANIDLSEEVRVEEEHKFGTFLGVFVPCILMLFGVIIFLRLGWIVGIIGINEALIIITLSALIALVTTLSMSAIATNNVVGKGGVYYMLSRSLGIEVGGAVGIPMYIRESLTIAFCCIGFSESLHDLVPSWSIANIGLVTLCVLTALAYTSLRGALKVQMVIFVVIAISLISLFTGGELAPVPDDVYTPAPLTSIGFWAVFAIFFPAMTGLESSVSLSGDLRNPSRSLPIGTISAMIIAYLIYVGISLFLAYRVPMDRLAQDPLIMQDLASVPSLIVLGIWGCTLSSTLGGLLSAPRTLQAIADDGLAPKVFSKTFGPMSEPRIATLATFCIAVMGTYFGSVNVLAPLLTMVSLICYGVLNLSAGMETLMANPSWRPRFRVHWSISLIGAALCLIAMLMIDAGSALLSLLFVAALYFFVRKRKYESSWTDIRDGLLLFFSRTAIYSLAYAETPSKSWRPHFLVFTKSTSEHSTGLLKFAQGISQSKGFLTMASFIAPGTMPLLKRKEISIDLAKRFKAEKIQALIQIKEAEKITLGMHNMIEYYGLGPLAPNTIVFGGFRTEDESIDFVHVLRLAYRRHNNVVIMNDASRLDTGEGKDLHIWWDDEYQNNSELMLVLGYMLQLDPTRKGCRLSVKAIVPTELDRKEKQQQLAQIALLKRLPIDIETYVASDVSLDRCEIVKEFSKNADLVFLGLKPPPKISEIEDYINYLQTLTQAFEGMPLALVLSSEFTPLDSILE
ncbi:MAG: amino acid permease [Parachlamydiaceae bacterium]|nr:amino acid permease [Parachlamydiaceae bacterium]